MLSIVQERIQYLQELGEFMGSARKSVKDAAERLGWKPRPTPVPTALRSMVTCPLNPGHRVAEDRFQDHLQACKWRSEGYLSNAIVLPESCAETPTKSIVLDSQLLEKIIREAASQDSSMKTGALGTGYRPIPQTSDRLLSDFTTDERRAIYDYVISQTGGVETMKLEDLQLPFESEKKNAPKTKLELLAEERDAKRRRISYRSKKVSTNRKSHTEVMREVIQNQMHLYETWLKKDEEVNEEENESDLQQAIKQERQDNDCEKSENKSGNKQYNYTSRTNSEQDEGESRRDSRSGPSRISYASSSRDKYKQDRLKYTDSNYSRNHHKSRPRESRQSHSREYYHAYQNESVDRHNSRLDKGDGGYRDKESRSTRDKYYEKDKRDSDKMHRPKSRNRRENSLSKGERNYKFRNPEGNKDSSNSDILHGSDTAKEKGDYAEQKYSQTEEFEIFQDMQRLLDAQVAADKQSERFNSSRSLSDRNEDKVVRTSFESLIGISKDSSDDSDDGIRHKSRSHKRKKRKKSKYKKKKHSKKSKKKEASSSSNDSGSDSSSFSC